MSVSFRALLPGDLSLNESAVCIGVILKADAFQAARMTYDAIVMDLFSALRTDDHQCALEVTAKSNDGSIEEEVVSVGQF
ncbi:unnamed protein product [Heligmosomoides polygyrus]|uniref:ACT domain-containing protein n=1 Tax=Heligmosomoides polygyrus TaxID=6339 RepID=A0A183GC74_HELPZ|nr:unnamed protein product [Heligmosomoides polygyrus]